MPHFGLMSTAESFQSPEGAMFRARLHVRAGRRRMRQGKTSAAILTYYDALSFAMRAWMIDPSRRQRLSVPEGADLSDDRAAFLILRDSGVLGSFAYDAFDELIDSAMQKDLAADAWLPWEAVFNAAMAALDVTPFDEASLPPEDPSTF